MAPLKSTVYWGVCAFVSLVCGIFVAVGVYLIEQNSHDTSQLFIAEECNVTKAIKHQSSGGSGCRSGRGSCACNEVHEFEFCSPGDQQCGLTFDVQIPLCEGSCPCLMTMPRLDRPDVPDVVIGRLATCWVPRRDPVALPATFECDNGPCIYLSDPAKEVSQSKDVGVISICLGVICWLVFMVPLSYAYYFGIDTHTESPTFQRWSRAMSFRTLANPHANPPISTPVVQATAGTNPGVEIGASFHPNAPVVMAYPTAYPTATAHPASSSI